MLLTGLLASLLVAALKGIALLLATLLVVIAELLALLAALLVVATGLLAALLGACVAIRTTLLTGLLVILLVVTTGLLTLGSSGLGASAGGATGHSTVSAGRGSTAVAGLARDLLHGGGGRIIRAGVRIGCQTRAGGHDEE